MTGFAIHAHKDLMATAAATGGRSNGEGLPAGSPSLFAPQARAAA
jgi:hypothetical protein